MILVKVREISYSRLFNLENYNNERIEFRAEIEDGQDENKAMAELFFKVLQVENSFAMYREFMRKVETLDSEIKSTQRTLKRYYEVLYELEVERLELDAKKEKDQCRIISIEEQYKNTLEKIEKIKESLRELVKKRNDALYRLLSVKTAILNGDFVKFGEPQPKDAEDLIKSVQTAAQIKVKSGHHVDVDPDVLG
ncbi:hypothetical protein DRP04_05860 [Archaeoglobales archaeon]|nr:MAG: hypothetical protein DRP04_05860 [Archaeoglobales archaeon]